MNDNFIICSFPRFAGGKFIGNCLALSKHFCPQDAKCAEYLIAHPDDYNFRLNAVMSTLPHSRDQMADWITKFEFGDNRLYGTSHRTWLTGIKTSSTALVDTLISSGIKMLLTAHGGDEAVRNLLNMWPGATIVKLINHVEFSTISKKIKSTDNLSLEDHAGNYCKSKYLTLASESWPTWEEFESVGYDIRKLNGYSSVADEILNFYNWKNINNPTFLFNIDNCIFNRTKFLTAMENLYRQLGLTDYNPDLTEKFWQSYMALHVDNVDLM